MRGATSVTPGRYAELDAAAEDWLHSARASEPDPEACRELWVCVLADAISLVRGLGIPRQARSDWGRNTAEDRRRAADWMRSEDSDVGSFVWICELLSLDPEVVRERVIHRSAEQEIRYKQATYCQVGSRQTQ